MTAIRARDLVSSNPRPRVAGAHSARAGEFNQDAEVTPEDDERRAGWRQQQLALEQDRSGDRSDRPARSDRAARNDGAARSDRQAGLVGIAQAREALAEAVRRAQSRAETKAA
jgi:hypothetical protein